MYKILIIFLLGLALSCPNNCQDCRDPAFCLSCAEGYQLDVLGNCINQIITNCQLYGPKGECFICQATFTLSDKVCKKQYTQSCTVYDFGLIPKEGKCLGSINCKTNTQKCMQCLDGFTFSSNLCIDSTGNCQIVSKNGVCERCKPGYALIGYICINQNIKAYGCYIYDSNGVCRVCKRGYQLYQGSCLTSSLLVKVENGQITVDSINAQRRGNSNGFNSFAFSASFDNFNGNFGVNQTPQTIFGSPSSSNNLIIADNIPKTVTQPTLPTNCKEADQSSPQLCKACLPPFSLDKGICKTQPQPSGTITLSIRDPNCARYNSSTCLQCSFRYYFTPSGSCAPVNPMCKQYGSDGTCYNCYPGYTLTSTYSCAVSKIKDPFCSSYTQGGLCIQCYKGYYLNIIQKICLPLNQACKSSNMSDGTCTSCFPGYSLVNSTCLVSIQDPNCLKFAQNKFCQQCANRYFLDSIGKCKQVSSLCKTYNQFNGACQSCYQGFVVSGSGCIGATAGNSDQNCKTSNKGICLQCYSGYYLNPNSTCLPINSLCKTSDPNTGACQSCYQGYTLSIRTCIPTNNTDNSDPNCKSRSSLAICTACYTGFYLSSELRCNKMDPLCRNYTALLDSCSDCYEGYTLVDSKCVIITQSASGNTDPFCIKLQGSQCLQCSNGYYISNNICTQTNPLCKSSDANGLCTNCYTGFTLTSGTCIQTQAINIPNCLQILGSLCITCQNGYLLFNGTCIIGNVLCSNYDQNQICSDCINGYVLQGGDCILPSLGIDPHCKKYVNSYCSICQDGFALINYWCGGIDQNCFDFDQNTNTCLKCIEGKIAMGPSCV